MRLRFFSILIGSLVFVGLLGFVLGPVLFASIAFPLEKADAVEINNWTSQYCSGISNPNSLMAGLIMTESGWRTDARSGAGAVGLTQFMPSTAVGVARQLGVSPFSPSDLLTNRTLAIRFGVYYVCARIQDYGGNVTKGLIAYNGGGGAVVSYELGFPIRSTVGYANTILSRQKGYAAVYGANLEKAVSGATTTSSNGIAQFTVQPKVDVASLATTSIFDFWRGWLASAPQTDAVAGSGNTGGLTNFWQNLLPGQ
ncbi:MAG TPA: transglycosylase SLT domain-containing protein [Candidatus Saccharimonadales bacterium]|nr:transglycosylase SLT domain-containing protein [Candidatus Saccharimonadales bacterium]